MFVTILMIQYNKCNMGDWVLFTYCRHVELLPAFTQKFATRTWNAAWNKIVTMIFVKLHKSSCCTALDGHYASHIRERDGWP